MGKPIWITQAGTLGTLQEGVFYELLMEAVDPDGEQLDYRVIAGYMSPGLVLNSRSGEITGKPKNLYFIHGVPFDVNQDITNTFCVRITNSTGQISDRTFSITVTGQDAPVIVTPPSELARVIDGSYVNIQLEATDLDLEPLRWSIASGELPPGLEIDENTGLISGYVLPTVNSASESTAGWDSPSAGWEDQPWDHSVAWVSLSFQFTVEVTDGKEYAQTTYTIFVYSAALLTADNTELTADDVTFITADLDGQRPPVLDPLGENIIAAEDPLTPIELGIFEHDNYFAYQFTGVDFDNDLIEFGIDLSGDLDIPPSLEFNNSTGWLYGKILQQTNAQTDYKFGVYVYKKEQPTIRSATVYYTLTMVGDLANAIIWTSPSNLGSIPTGAISELAVSSTNANGTSINYTLDSGSSLPLGLVLLNNGLIIGRSSFEYTSFDKGATTFDVTVREAGVAVAEVTIDCVYTFTVQAASADLSLLSRKTFTITIDPSSFEPYESLYLRANPGQAGKDLFISISGNTDIVQAKDVYRDSDPYFGRALDARVMLISGLNSSVAGAYISAMSQNHYRKTLKFGAPEVSKAFDVNQNVLYEVLYYNLYDDQANTNGSTSSSIDLRNKINRTVTIDNNDVNIDTLWTTMDGGGDRIAYPNSLVNMRNQMIDEIGFGVREVLPTWMSSRQLDGSIIGWKPVVVIAYLKPGAGKRALFNLKRLGAVQQTNISFEVDRYILDNNLSKTFNTSTGEYFTSNETTFDNTFGLVESDPVATVDFALDIPFSEIDGRDSAYITANGGLDGLVGVYDNKTLIFATQEQYAPPLDNEPYEGWLRNNAIWDDASGWDSDAGWDNYELITGYTESNGTQRSVLDVQIDTPTNGNRVIVSTTVDHGYANRDKIYIENVGGMTEINNNYYYVSVLSPASFVLYNDWSLTDRVDGSGFAAYTSGGTVGVRNLRGGVWKIVRGEDDIFRLEFQQIVETDDNVFVNGFKYGGYLLKYGPAPVVSQTVPGYAIVEELIERDETTFDDTQTRFIDNITTYAELDQGDKYLAFPRNNIWV